MTRGSCPSPCGRCLSGSVNRAVPARLANPLVYLSWVRTPPDSEGKKTAFGGFLFSGGEGGIRTHDGLLTHTPLAGERLQPLGHLSNMLLLQYRLLGYRGAARITKPLVPGKGILRRLQVNFYSSLSWPPASFSACMRSYISSRCTAISLGALTPSRT